MAESHVISSLKAKRAELDGELMQAERRAIQIRTDLDAIDRALHVFDPEIRLSAIRSVVRRSTPRFFAHGHFTRAALDTLRRAQKPLSFREIAERMNAEHNLDVAGRPTMRQLVSKVQAVFGRDRPGIKRGVADGVTVVSMG